ncbi:MAG: hypothetical protein CMN65_03695 [Sphingomonadaceae bacterium]|nr:hypothetical protein [Sphingomonadaceae bacterium]
MSTKVNKTRNKRWKPRTAEDRARDRAVNRAIANAGDQKGPIIVRLGKKTPTKPVVLQSNKPAPLPPKKRTKAAKVEDRVNSAMADALLAAGVTVPPKGEKKVEPASKVSGGKAEKKRTKKAEKKARVAVTPKPRPAKQKKKKKAPTPPARGATEMEAEKATKRQKRFLAELRKKAAAMQGELTPADLRWQQRQDEIAALIEAIQGASFNKLAVEWKKHVALAGYIEETGRKRERLDTYTHLIAAIEREWGRRAKLKFNSEQYFDWPSTLAGKSRKGGVEINWASEGFLSYLGYHVGESSDLTDHARRAILRRTFKMVLPPLESPDYVKSWGPPSSPARLKKMAHSLASFARSAKRRSSASFALAISEWEADLAMLREEFYVAKFGFGWPQV